MSSHRPRLRPAALLALLALGVVACSTDNTPASSPLTTPGSASSAASTGPTTDGGTTAAPLPIPSAAVTVPTLTPVPADTATASVRPSTAAVTTPTPTAAACPLPGTGFDCDFQRRIAVVQTYLRTRPGTVGIVLRDRQTGAVWRNQYVDTMVWTASTIKLAMIVDLFTRDRAGLISLTATDRTEIQEMLHTSDDDAADALWFRYAGADHLTYNDRFPAYGMTSLQPQKGFTNYYPYWGFQKCTPADLDRLIQYVLTRLDPADRAYIVDQLQHVAPVQQWGVWGAGTAAAPGNKDGWSLEQGGWVINSVGFAGPGQRYTLAMMNSLNGQGGYDEGTATLSRVAHTLFAGRF